MCRRAPSFGMIALLVACAAPPPTPPDTTGPWLLGLEPGGNSVPVDAAIIVRFSEPVQRDGVFVRVRGTDRPDGVVLAPESAEADLLAALDAPPLSDALLARLVPSTLGFSVDRKSVTLRPARPLVLGQGYVVIVSRKVQDDAGNRLRATADDETSVSVSARFYTGGADRDPPHATLLSPAAGAVRVDPGWPTVRVQFDEPIDSGTLRPDTIGLRDLAESTPRAVDSVAWDDERRVATVTLAKGGGGCETLCPSHTYALSVAPNVRDLAGNGTATPDPEVQRFSTASCFDRSPPRVASSRIVATPTDIGATLGWVTDEPGHSRIEVVAGPATALAGCGTTTTCATIDVDSSATTCTTTFDACATPPAESAYSCARTATVGDLSPETAYAARVTSFDALGHATRTTVTFTTDAPRPRLVLSEVFAAPVAPLDANAEFIELANLGTGDADLTGHRVVRCPDNPCTSSFDLEWALAFPDGDPVLPAGGVALVAGSRLPVSLLGLPEGTRVFGGPTQQLLSRGLRDSDADGYALIDDRGRVVTKYAAQLGAAQNQRGRSFERIDPDSDATLAWTPATEPLPLASPNQATPGQAFGLGD